MTRTLLLVLSLLSLTVQAQTYVRPSKGAAFSPFSQTGLDGGYPLTPPVIGLSYVQGLGPYDWSAFEAVQVRLYTDGVGSTTPAGAACNSLSSQYTIANIGAFLRFRLVKSASQGWSIQALDGPTVNGPFLPMSQVTNGSVSLADWHSCNLRVQVTPMPFAPASISVAVNISDDGGVIFPTANNKPTCTAVKMATTQVGTSALAVPADGGLSGRWYERVCNSPRNSGTPILTCTDDGQTPTVASTSSGDVLEIGDCATYYTTTTVTCISDITATQVTSEECQ